MASGSFTKQVGNRSGTENEYIQVWWESTPDAANNKSKVRAYAKMYRPWYIAVDYNQDIEMWIDGTKYTDTRYGWRGQGWTEAYIDKTKTVTHNADGTKSINIRVRTQVKAWLRKWVGWVDTGNQLCKLDNLARKSSFSLNKSSAKIGDTITVNLSRSSSSVRHAITIKVGNTTKTILSKSDDNGSTTSYSYTLSAADLLPAMTGKSVNAKIIVTTYNGSTSLGSNEKTFTLNIRDTDKPVINDFSISAVPVAPNTITDIFISGKSKARINIDITPTDTTSGKIISYKVAISEASGQLGSYTTYKSNDITLPILSGSGDYKISIYVIDARGTESTTFEKTIKIFPYNSPVITSFSINRCTSNGEPNNSGTFIECSAKYHFYSCNFKNSVRITLMGRTVTDSNAYQPINTWELNASNSLFGHGSIAGRYEGYSVDQSYDFKLIITDSFGATYEAFTEIGTEEMLIDLSPNGVGVGKIVERENAFEVGWDSYLENVTLGNGSGLYGTKSDNTKKKVLNLDSNNDLNISNTGKDIKINTIDKRLVPGEDVVETIGTLYINDEPFAPKKVLWEGSKQTGETDAWNKDTLDIPNACKYRMFLISVKDDTENHGTIIPAIKNTVINKNNESVTMVRGVGGYVSTVKNTNGEIISTTEYTYHFNAGVTEILNSIDEKWSFNDCTWIYHGNESTHGTRKFLKVTKIEGLI